MTGTDHGDIDQVASAALALGQTIEILRQTPSALITDIDGTISSIVARPDDATVSETIKAALRTIGGRLALTAVITGRPETVARSMVAVDGLTYIGHYGLDEEARFRIGSGPLQIVLNRVRDQIALLDGVVMEEKGVSFSLHYRHSPDRQATRAALIKIAAAVSAETGARVVPGKQVIELVPADLPNKGVALEKLLATHGIKGAVYFGDDLSDIDVFTSLKRRRESGLASLSIAVVDSETDESVRAAADLRLAGVARVEEVLADLAEGLLKEAKDG